MTALEDSKNKKSKMYLFVIVLVLALINMVLIYKLVTNNQKLSLTQETLTGTQAELVEVERLKAALDEELSFYVGQNDSLDQVISLKQAELEKRANRIKDMLSKENITKAELARAKQEILGLRSQMDALTNEVDSLSRVNQALVEENYVITKQLEQKDQIVEEMTATNDDLNQQVAVGKRIFLKSLSVTPLRKALLGSKFKATDKLSRMRKLNISFILANNDLADKGEKTLYFKIQTPNKSTLVDEGLGAGTFNYQGGESMYTVKKVINFQNSNEAAEIIIMKSDAFTKGEYVVNVYSDTHLMSSTKFVLR